jgi:hypothetical protein
MPVLTMNEILEKIKKLLRLAESSNTHEAELAMARAFELAARHSIDLSSVDVDEDTKRLLHKRFGIGMRLSQIRMGALNIVHNYFNVNVVWSRPDAVVIGTETEVEIAWYVIGFLSQAASRGLRQHQMESARKLSPAKKRGYVAGFFYGVSSKLRVTRETLEIEGPLNALVLRRDQERKEYQDTQFQTATIPERSLKKNKDSLRAGYVDGWTTEINKGLEGKQTSALLLNG